MIVYNNGAMKITMFEDNHHITMFHFQVTVPGAEKSFVINKDMFDAMQRAAPKTTPSDGPENSAQQLQGGADAPKPPHPDCYMFGGCGCENVRLDVGRNAAASPC